MYDLHRDLIDAFKAMPETLTALLDGVSEAQARSAKGGDENWSVLEVVCHLRDAAQIGLQRMEAMRDQENPRISGYDQEALARERKYREDDLCAALAAFIAARGRHVAALSTLEPEQWERQGEHSELGRITIFEHTAHMASHDAVHCAQIASQLLAAKGKR
jgi:hypothetical protein